MPEYRVVKPIAVEVEDGKTRHYPTRGVVVELSDEQAAPLLENGRIEPVSVDLDPIPAENQLPPGDNTEKVAEGTGEPNTGTEVTGGEGVLDTTGDSDKAEDAEPPVSKSRARRSS